MRGMSILGRMTGYFIKKYGEKHIAPINSKFLLPSPNANAGATANKIMKILISVLDDFINGNIPSCKKVSAMIWIVKAFLMRIHYNHCIWIDNTLLKKIASINY